MILLDIKKAGDGGFEPPPTEPESVGLCIVTIIISVVFLYSQNRNRPLTELRNVLTSIVIN